MKNICKRTLAMLLTLVLLFGMLPAAARAEESNQTQTGAGDATVEEPVCTFLSHPFAETAKLGNRSAFTVEGNTD